MAALERREWRLIPGVPAAGKLPERLLAGRGFGEPSAADGFLRPSLDHLHDPFLMPDLERACTLVGLALAGREPILIHGDYDVDGITATALLTRFFRDIGAECATLIPDRLADGYGLTAASVAAVLQSGCKLLITVDCGTTSFDEVARLNQAGIPVIITDHHDCRETLPEAAAVINPKRADSAYPFAYLAGVGVALKFLQGLCLKLALGDLWQKHLDLAALGTVADIMPLRDENRILVAAGLEQLNSLPGGADRLSTGRAPYRRTFGLGVLLQSAGQPDRPATAQTLGYLLAPRINASGRLGDAADALSLLLTEDQATADHQASLLHELNRQRQEIETTATAEAMKEIDSQFDFSGSDFIVAARPNWHPGVIGIVASRLAEQYGRPAIVLTAGEEGYRGSCRTWGDVDILAALKAVSSHLIRFGGHRKAAGLTLAAGRLDDFRLALGQYAAEHAGLLAARPVLNADAEVTGADLTLDNALAIRLMEPFGEENPVPSLICRNLNLTGVRPVGGGRHLKLSLQDPGRQIVLDAIAFGQADGADWLKSGGSVDLLFNMEVNEWQGRRSVQLNIRDIHPALPALLPDPPEYKAVYQYLKNLPADGPASAELSDLAREINRICRLDLHPFRLARILAVFQETGLIERQSLGAGRFRLTVLPVAGKVSLEDSPTYRLMLSEREGMVPI